MAPSELQSVPTINGGKMSGYLSRLERSGRKQRPTIINEVQGYLLSHPALAIEGISFLTEKQGNRNAKELLEKMQPENVIEFLSKNGKTAKKTDFLNIFDSLNGSGNEIAQAMMIGYLQQPTQELKDAKKDLGKQQKAAVKANKIGSGLAAALLETADLEIKSQVVKVIEQNLAKPENRDNLFIDFLFANSAFARPMTEAAQADEILRYINMLSMQLNGVDIARKYSLFVNRFDKPIELTPGMSLTLFHPTKEPSLSETWGNPKEPYRHSFEKITLSLVDQLAKRTEKFSTEPIILTVDEPQTTEVGAAAINLFLEHIAHKLEVMPGDFTWKIIPAPQGRKILAFGEKFDLDPLSPEVWQQIYEKILQYSERTDNPVSHLPMKQEELDTNLEFLKPADIDEVKLSAVVPKIIKEAQGGLHAISKKGIRSKLELPQEKYLRNLGLQEIFFRQEENGIRVNTTWNNGEFSFFINRNYEIHGLNKLTESNRNFLLAITFSYLRAIKNRGEEKIIFLNEPQLTESTEENEDEKVLSESSGRQVARDPFLRVLALGDYSHEISDPLYERDVEFHYGIGLAALNSIFLQIQENKSLIMDPKSEINQYFDSFSYGHSIKNLIMSIFSRAEKKVSQPRWIPGKLAGENVLQFRPTNPPEGYNSATDLYMLTFVRETERPDSKPREVNCPGVAEKILDLAMAH